MAPNGPQVVAVGSAMAHNLLLLAGLPLLKPLVNAVNAKYFNFYLVVRKSILIFGGSNRNTPTKMTGTEKQITWANEIITHYNAAREVVMAKVAAAPEANRLTIIDAIAKIDAKLNDQAHAGDIIARAQVYFTGGDRDVPALMDAIRTIAKGNDTVLNAA